MIIPEEVREQLKEPLGKVYHGYSWARKAAGKGRIISVGDVCTLGLLGEGVVPHLAVFDFRCMRRPLGEREVSALRKAFPDPAVEDPTRGLIRQEKSRACVKFGRGVPANFTMKARDFAEHIRHEIGKLIRVYESTLIFHSVDGRFVLPKKELAARVRKISRG
jgi:hypothetical protein